MELNYTAIVIATVLQFIVGAIWYMALFGNLWGKIHGFEKYSKAEQQKMAKGMAPFYLLQLATTFVTTVVLAMLLQAYSGEWSAYALAALCWIGFIVPTQVSAVIFGGTEGKWIVKKIAIMAGGALAWMMVAATVLQNMW